MVKALPNTSFLPVSKSAPAGHATAAAHLLWQVFPRYPCLEYKDNSGQSCPVRYTWTASFGRGLMFWQKRFNLTPQFVAYQFPGHLLHPHWYFTAYSSICQVLLGALKGICKKVLIIMLVGVAHIVDLHVVGTGNALRGAVVCFYLSNEGVSLLENAAHLGLPIPEKMKSILAQLHNRIDDTTTDQGGGA